MHLQYRRENDMIGAMEIPAECYYGIHAARSARNFPLSGRRSALELIHALALVKKACCAANAELGYLDRNQGQAIAAACDDIIAGKLDKEFITDALQGGAGTSSNMNVNEVIANRALELLGHGRGAYNHIHPLDHVNLHQSTNDVCPTALKVAAIFGLHKLSAGLNEVEKEFRRLALEFADIVKIGRTQLQDAVPMTLGAEFSAFAEAFARDCRRVGKSEECIRTVNLGGTAIGTGITAPPDYISLVIEKLRELSRLDLRRGENSIDQTANQDGFVEVSAILKVCAVNFQKICRDLRLLHTFGEINLAPRQAGSSIMPGKVNPVMIESLLQGAMQVRSCMLTLEECAAGGTLQINEYMPLISDSLLTGLKLMNNMCPMLCDALSDLAARHETCQARFDHSPLVITAFIPHIGYDRALALLDEFRAAPSGPLRDFLKRKLDPELVDRVLDLRNLIILDPLKR